MILLHCIFRMLRQKRKYEPWAHYLRSPLGDQLLHRTLSRRNRVNLLIKLPFSLQFWLVNLFAVTLGSQVQFSPKGTMARRPHLCGLLSIIQYEESKKLGFIWHTGS